MSKVMWFKLRKKIEIHECDSCLHYKLQFPNPDDDNDDDDDYDDDDDDDDDDDKSVE